MRCTGPRLVPRHTSETGASQTDMHTSKVVQTHTPFPPTYTFPNVLSFCGATVCSRIRKPTRLRRMFELYGRTPSAFEATQEFGPQILLAWGQWRSDAG